MKITEYFVYEYQEMDKVIEEEYGHKFSVLRDQDAHNDTCLAFNDITKDDDFEKDGYIEVFRKNGKYDAGCFLLRSLLDDMVNRGVIKPGNYLIDICW
jgi:hypothetical protein